MQGVEQDPLDTSDAPPGAMDGASEESNDSQGNYRSSTFSSQPWQLWPLQHGQLRQEGGKHPSTAYSHARVATAFDAPSSDLRKPWDLQSKWLPLTIH